MPKRILIINPNSSVEMTRVIQAAAEEFASGDFEVDTESIPTAPEFIDSYEDEQQAAPGMVESIRRNQSTWDAFVVACHCDPNLDLMKEISDKPVVGIGEASMKLASMLGDRFSVLSATRQSVPNKRALVRKYNLQASLASVRAPDEGVEDLSDEDRYFQMGRAAIDEDLAEVLVLGCAGLAGLDKRLQERLGVPVLDGVVCALVVAEGLVRYEVSTSKVRRYRG